jgi:hypothetical protein
VAPFTIKNSEARGKRAFVFLSSSFVSKTGDVVPALVGLWAEFDARHVSPFVPVIG